MSRTPDLDLSAPGDSEPDIRRVLDEPGRLNLVAQPIVDLRQGDVVGYEILSRFRLDAPTSPDRVFEAAVRQGLGAELEARVIERGLVLAETLPENCFLSVNVDPSTLTTECVIKALEQRPSLAGIVLELTEHRAIEDLPGVVSAVAWLRQRGALVAMDDAGAGYSGLKQILELRPQLLKLDRALITDIDDDPAKRALVQMIGELAGRLDAWLLAEGIETEAELRVLRQLGVPLGQGYFLARPTAPWAALRAEASAMLRGTPAAIRGPSIAHRLLERCATCRGDEPWPAAKIAVRLVGDRPIAMKIVEGCLSHERASHELLRIKRESSLAAIGQRAVTRDEAYCWDPLVCVDELGHYIGIVRMPRLVSALAELARELLAQTS